MKKVFFLSFLCFFLLTGQAIGADALYRMLNADEVESFKEDQDAIIVGQLVDEKGKGFIVDVLKVISGKVNSKEIVLADPEDYGWIGTEPKIGDYCVISVKKVGRKYEKAWGIYKADSGDYRTLNLIGIRSNSKGWGDLACIEWYVNSGGTEKGFSFKDGNAFVKRPNGEVVQIYPKETNNNIKPEIQEPVINNDGIDSKQEDSYVYIGIIAITLLIVISLVIYRKTKKRPSQN